MPTGMRYATLADLGGIVLAVWFLIWSDRAGRSIAPWAEGGNGEAGVLYQPGLDGVGALL